VKQRVSLLLVAAASLAGCAHHGRPLTPTGEDEEHLGFGQQAHKKSADPAPVEAHLLASLNAHTVGPFLARARPAAGTTSAPDDERGMMAYLGAADDGTRALLTVPIDSVGMAAAEPIKLVPTREDAANLAVRATSASGGTTGGYAAAFSSLTDRGEAIYAVGIATDGQLRAPLTELSGTTDHVVWLDLLTTPTGATCIWAEETRSGQANLFAAALDADGKLHGSPSRVARNVRAWQTVGTDDGVGIALVVPVEGRRGEGAGGSLSFLRLDGAAHAEGAPVVLTTQPEVGGDIDVVRAGSRYVFAWTDVGEADPFVATASLEASGQGGKPGAPVRAVATPTGGSSLVALEAAANGTAAILWDEPRKRGRATRRVHLQRLSPPSAVVAAVAIRPNGASPPPPRELRRELPPPATREPEVALDVAGAGNVELVATPDGYALLADSTPCQLPPSDGPRNAPLRCDAAPMPTFLRFDANLRPVDVQPLKMEADRTPARLAWALGCGTGGTCTALTVDAGSPAKVRDVRLVSKVDATYRAPVAPSAPEGAARVTSLRTVADGAQYSDLAAVPCTDGGDLVAALAANGAPDATGGDATLSLVPVDAEGVAGAPVVLTTRAVLAGGIALARAGTDAQGAAVAWVGRDNGDLQVHVSHVDRRGRRLNDVMLTTAKGDASDVTLGWANGGWLVGWVDGRDGNGEVYATKVGLDLTRVAREERITSAPGDATDLAMFARDGQGWLAWADPRDDETGGTSDLYYAKISARDAKREGGEVRALASTTNSRSPSLTGAGDGVALAWIEDPPLGVDTQTPGPFGAMLLSIDAAGKARGEPVRLRNGGDGFATGITIGPTEAGGLRGVLSRSVKDDLAIDVLEIGGAAGSTRAAPLLAPDAPSSFDVVLALAGRTLYFDDDGTGAARGRRSPAGADRRVRRAQISWAR
jgi:hypothetical protein